MSGVAVARQEATHRTRVPGEIEARHLLIAGVPSDKAAEITGLEPQLVKAMAKHIKSFGDGPYSSGRYSDIAQMLGLNWRDVYRLIDSGALKAGIEGIARESLRKMVEARLRHDGERKARFLLFIGKKPALAAIRGRMPLDEAKALAKQLDEFGAGPDSKGPYTVTQASVVLGLENRQVRAYCQHGKFGELQTFGSQYMIPRKRLEAFGAQDRKYGCQASRWEE